MDWKELERMVSKRGEIDPNHDEDDRYFDALSRLNWVFPEDSMPENAEVLLEFLARHDSGARSIDREHFEEVWLESVEALSADLEDLSLERLTVLEFVNRAEENIFCAGDAISRVYEDLKAIPGVGMTNASRLLHLRFPGLFVATDELVRKYWEESNLPGVFNISKERLFEPYGYSFIFLPAMGIQAVDAIMSCSLDEDVSVEEAAKRLQGLGGRERTVAKLVSDYYYALTSVPEQAAAGCLEPPPSPGEPETGGQS